MGGHLFVKGGGKIIFLIDCLPLRTKIMPSRSILIIFLSLFFLGLAGPVAGQQSGSGLGLYNPQTVETVSGIVVSGPSPGAQAGVPEPVFLTLKIDQGKINVILGPRHFVDQQGVKIAALDKIQVTGSRILFQGKPVIIAAEIKKGDQVLKLREPSGIPLWGGRGRSQ